MALAETAKLVVDLSLQGNFLSQTSKVNKALGTMNTKLSQTEGRAYKAGQQIGTGIKRGAVLAAAGIGILVTQIGFGLDQLIQLESLTAQTNAVLKSTKGVSGQTADSVRALAEEFEGLNATVDDKVIQSGENLLLTFTEINKKAFKPSLQAALDLSTALGVDLDSAVRTVGKALSDPAKAAGKLARQGIILTKSEQKQIAAHLKNNDALGAQNVILAALQKRYGGSFLAGGQTTAGKVAKFGDAIEDLQKNLATALLPAIGNIADALNTLFRDPETIAAVKKLGDQVGKLFSKENIKTGIQLLKDGFNTLKAIAGPIADVVGAAVKAFASLPPEIKTLLVGGVAVNKITGGLVTNLAGGLISAVISSFKGMMNVNAAVVNVNGPVAGAPGGGVPGGAKGVVSDAASVGGLGLAGLAQLTTLAAVPLIPLVAAYFLAGGEKGIANRDLGGRTATATARGLNPANVPTTTTPGMQSPIAGWAAGRAIKDASKVDSRATLQVEQAIKRTAAATQTKIATGLARTKSAIDETKGATKSSASSISAAQRAAAASISGAVHANRPVVTTNVKVSVSGNSVNKVVTVTGRYGQPAGSRNQNNIGVSGAR